MYIIKDLLNDPSYYLDDDYANCEYTVRNVPERVFQAVDVLLFKYEPRNLHLREVSSSLFSFIRRGEIHLRFQAFSSKIQFNSR